MGLSRDPLESLESTAFCVEDSRAAIAYRVDLQEWGPNGENRQGFVLETFDGGHSWFPVTLARTIGPELPVEGLYRLGREFFIVAPSATKLTKEGGELLAWFDRSFKPAAHPIQSVRRTRCVSL